jgi:hypothetical protein
MAFIGVSRETEKLRKLNFWEAGEPRVLESGSQWRGLRRRGGRDAEAETGPEAVNVATWGGEPGRDLEVSGPLPKPGSCPDFRRRGCP